MTLDDMIAWIEEAGTIEIKRAPDQLTLDGTIDSMVWLIPKRGRALLVRSRLYHEAQNEISARLAPQRRLF